MKSKVKGVKALLTPLQGLEMVAVAIFVSFPPSPAKRQTAQVEARSARSASSETQGQQLPEESHSNRGAMPGLRGSAETAAQN